jgi:hypothetical protein
MPPSAAPRRRRRWLWRCAAALVAVVGLSVAFAAFDHWRQRRAWQEACAEADRLDPGWRWEDLSAAYPAVPAERNSVVHARATAGLLSDAGLPNGLKTQKLDREYQQLLPQHRPSPEIVAGLREHLDANGPALAEARQLADCPSGRVELPASPVILAKGTNPFEILAAVRSLLYTQLVLQVEADEPDAALVTVRAIAYTARPLSDCPELINALIAVALRNYAARGVERVLAQGEPSPTALDAARRLLELEVSRPLLLAAFRGERASVEDTARALDEGRLTRSEMAQRGLFFEWHAWTRWPKVDHWLNRLTGAEFSLANATARIRHLTWTVERLKESPDGLMEHADEWAALRDKVVPQVKGMMNHLAQYAKEVALDEARFRCAAVALAAEQFRRANGRWPAALDELVPTYLAAVPHDPQDGKPLRLARRPDGIVIYSVAADKTDDGGDIGAGAKRGRDVGVRLWDVDKRRQPPQPAGAGKSGS